jgi:hypothetical protein
MPEGEYRYGPPPSGRLSKSQRSRVLAVRVVVSPEGYRAATLLLLALGDASLALRLRFRDRRVRIVRSGLVGHRHSRVV